MKIALINKSDTTGGAAIFTYRLMKALRNSGIDAKLLVVEKLTNDPHVVSYSNTIKDKIAFIAERLQIFIANKLNRKFLFKVDTATFGRNIHHSTEIIEADIIILNWTNQGALSNKAIKKLCNTQKPILWIMHDMWCCTGICHHAYDCLNYQDKCGKCQYLNSTSPTDLSHQVWKIKQALYASPNLHFVAVSHWLANKCKQSSLLNNHTISVIPNTLPIQEFSYERRPNTEINLPDTKKILTIGAARLDDPVKGFPLLIQTLKELTQNYPSLSNTIHLLLYGNIKNKQLLHEIPVAYTYLGKISPRQIKDVLSHSDIILSTSHYESFGGTLIEGLAAGCIPVSFDNGGQTDIIDHLQNGYLATYPDTKDFAKGIHWALIQNIERSALHNSAAKKFSEEIIAKQYLSLISKITT